MSLKYRLFGSPANINEVVDRVQRTHEIPEIYATRKNLGTLVPDAQRFGYTVGVRIGRTKVPVYRWEQSFRYFVEELNRNRPDFVSANHHSQEEAKRLADELSGMGISVLCGDVIYSSKSSNP